MERYTKAWSATNRLIRQGHSFSGNERNCCFVNGRDGHFSDVSAASGLNVAGDGRAVAAVDWDRDGDLDLWLTQRTAPRLAYFENRHAQGTRALRLRLEGVHCNRDAIGARVEVWLRGVAAPRIRTVRAGHGYLSQSTSDVLVGLSPEEQIDRVVVRWPGCEAETIDDLQPGACYDWRQGDGPVERYRFAIRHTPKGTDAPAPLTEPSHSERSRTMLVARLPMPPLRVISREGESEQLSHYVSGRPTVVVLWAPWCQPCLAELAEWSQHQAAVNAAGVNVVAVNVDEFPTAAGDPRDATTRRDDAQRVLTRLSFPFASADATESFVQSLDIMQRTILDRERPLAIPCSFLLDGSGQLAAFYKGPVGWRTSFKATCRYSRKLRTNAAPALFPLTGRWLDPPAATDPMRIAVALNDAGLSDVAMAYTEQVEVYLQDGEGARYMAADLKRRKRIEAAALRGVLLIDAGHPKLAIQPLLQCVDLDPDDLRSRMKLGEAYTKIGDPKNAVEHLQHAAQLAPDDPEIHYDLALSLTATGRAHHAIDAFRRSLDLLPNWPPAANNLAWILATHPVERWRDGATAVQLATEVCRRVNYRDPAALDTLAAALAESGHFDEATKTLRDAIRLAAGTGQ